jgi:G3E family GTPase
MGKVLNTGRFDFEKAEQHPLWFKELNGFKDHVPETDEYGIRSFVYRARQPFDPAKLQAFINRPWPGVVRTKGFFWLATRPHHVGELSQAGALVRTGKRGLWWSSVPKHRWPDHPEWREAMKPYLDPVWGDRRQEIVFIGCDPPGWWHRRKGASPRSDAAVRVRNCSSSMETPDQWGGQPKELTNRKEEEENQV